MTQVLTWVDIAGRLSHYTERLVCMIESVSFQTRQPKDYDRAVSLLIDLHDLYRAKRYCGATRC